MAARQRPAGAGRRLLPRPSLFLQWCLVFISAVAIMVRPWWAAAA